VFTLRVSPANPNVLLISTYGRGDWEYDFGSSLSSPGGALGPQSPAGTFSHGGPVCPSASGRVAAPRLGPVWLGFTRAHARGLLPIFSVTHYGFDEFCLRAGWGIRVGYPSSKLLGSLKRRTRPLVSGRVVLALTANKFYSLNGVRPGTSLTAVSRKLKLGNQSRFAVGLNDWYVVPGRNADGVLKVRNGVIQEIGIADKRLLDTRKARPRFFTSFRLA
jgi:hypothetical protein